ncbi:MAG: hypothetical protein B7Y43_00930 [Sphingomonas sp. 28-62-20]|uniref:anti-sigma factor n=1 Tax=Sphingomonas sp. 28-62-20 TaxID=1970433 RepID=UPI000BC36FA0|nr:MAG: hypothetical protein B7Y43_00930 [Sphingomonas sp. 28-62-20]
MTDQVLPDGDPDVMAAEFALGLLEGEALAAAMRRTLEEPGFAAEVERWRLHFGTLFESWPAATPPANGIDRLDRALRPVPAKDAANDDAPGLPRIRLWQGIAAATSALAASLLFVVMFRPAPPSLPVAPVVAARAPILVAAIVPVKNGAPIPAVFDPASGDLRVAATTLTDPAHSAELWIIAADGVPHSLGVLAPDQPEVVSIRGPQRTRFAAGSTLAVTIEPIGGSPSGKPTGAVIAAGALALI